MEDLYSGSSSTMKEEILRNEMGREGKYRLHERDALRAVF